MAVNSGEEKGSIQTTIDRPPLDGRFRKTVHLIWVVVWLVATLGLAVGMIWYFIS